MEKEINGVSYKYVPRERGHYFHQQLKEIKTYINLAQNDDWFLNDESHEILDNIVIEIEDKIQERLKRLTKKLFL